MTTRIDVVDINDNANDNAQDGQKTVTEEVKEVKEVKPKKPRAKAKAKAQPEPVKEEVIEPVVEEVKEPVVEEVKEEIKQVKPKAKPRAKKVKEEIKEEVIEPVKEEVKEPVKEEVKEEVKPKTSRDKLKDKVNCPDCGKEVTEHGLKYTHKKYCKALNKPEIEEAPPMPKLERTDTLQPIFEPDPTEEQVANYLLKLKKQKAMAKRDKMSSLVSKGLPQ